ncbi:MAG TPA: neuromedin U [Phycisphaerae bacterium]|nr:neuromedin U [Phycisphaerae bacterium]
MATLLSVLLLAPLTAAGQDDLQEPANKTQNHLPEQDKLQFQNYSNPGVVKDDSTQDFAFVVPTIRSELSNDSNLAAPTSTPTIDQPSLACGGESAFCTANIQPRTLSLMPQNAPAIAESRGPASAHTVAAAGSQSLLTLAKQTQNPVPDVIKLQFQNYFNFETGENKSMQDVLHVVATIPFKLNDDWKLVTRTELPLYVQPSLGNGEDSAVGMGDINPTFYFVPRKKIGGLTLGFGPTFTFPTATENFLGSGMWSAGPAAVLVYDNGPWLIGSRISNQWSFAGWRDQEYNRLWIQPFLHYNLSDGWYLAILPTITADWKASSGNKWTVPIGGGFGKHFRPLSNGVSFDLEVQGFYNVERPDGAPSSQLFLQLQVLFPK